jgi:hypothetical protein
MTQEDIIQVTLKDSNYHLSLFSADEIVALRRKIIFKESKGKKTPFVTCIIRDKDIQLKPEEIVRQLFAARLIQQYGYPKKRLAFEYAVTFGREKKSADIVVFDKDRTDTPYIIVELKKPKLKDGKDQLRSYCNATGAWQSSCLKAASITPRTNLFVNLSLSTDGYWLWLGCTETPSNLTPALKPVFCLCRNGMINFVQRLMTILSSLLSAREAARTTPVIISM